MVSVISTAVSLIVIAIVYGGLQLWSEVPSTIFGNAVATVPLLLAQPQVGLGQARALALPQGGRALLDHGGRSASPSPSSARRWPATSASQYNLGPLRADGARPGGQRLVVRHLLGASSSSSSTSSSTSSSRSSTSTSTADEEVAEPTPRRPRRRRAVRAQSRKLSNCRGMPKSSALHAAITSWRSSRFLPGDPQLLALGLRGHPLEAQVLDELVELLGVVRRDAGPDGDLLAGRALLGLFDLARPRTP